MGLLGLVVDVIAGAAVLFVEPVVVGMEVLGPVVDVVVGVEGEDGHE